MKAIIFIQKNDGTILYKCDTSWTQSVKFNNAKIHSDSDYDVNRLILNYMYNIEIYLKKHPENIDNIRRDYHECKMGFRTVDDDLLNKGGFSIKENTVEEDLGILTYTHEVLIDGNLPKIVDVRKRYIREEKITEILK